MIWWHGVSSDDMHVIVEHRPWRPIPRRKMTAEAVPGRSGDFIYQEDAWEMVRQQYDVYISADVGRGKLMEVSRAVAQWLLEPAGYQRLEDSYDLDCYRLAYFEGGVDVENILGRFGRCTLTFVCKPQRYLKSGDDWRRGAFIDYLVNNPTAHPASPLLHLQTDGAAMNGTVTVNGETVTVTDGPAELIIDTEEATAQWEGTDYTDKVAFSDIITLKPGANELSLDGISRCWVKPRWWVL